MINKVMALLKKCIRHILSNCGYSIYKNNLNCTPCVYDEDGLQSIHNHDFVNNPFFLSAYQRGVQASGGVDSRFQWRAHVVLWAAHYAKMLKGDFVECGVNKGFNSSAIMEYLSWNSLGKSFYLLDTFNGMDERFLTEEEVCQGKLEANQKILDEGGYERNVEAVKENFSQWQRVHIIQGSVPETLPQVEAIEVAYLHLDMNCAIPELAAAEFFWSRLVPGAVMLFDDYGYKGYDSQKDALDGFARSKGVPVLSLPTGQGIIIKPAISARNE